jgi:hypothetical protein
MRRSVLLGVCAGLACLGSMAANAQTPSAEATLPVVGPEIPWRWDFGATGETIFEHTRAGLRDPHFGMRLYYADPIPGTLHPVSNPGPGSDPSAATPDGSHLFWDVSFGESMPIFTRYKVDPSHARYAGGFQLNFDAGAFMLLDFTSQSSGVIDTDYRLGLSGDYRPWQPYWQHLSFTVGFFHESTHLGDEYVLSSGTIQGNSPPAANSFLPYRANPSYEAVPVTASLDWHFSTEVSGRVYGGLSKYLGSALPNEDYPSEWRAGAELRWTSLVGDGLTDVGETSSPSDSLVTKAVRNVIRRSTGLHAGEPVKTGAARTRTRRGPFGVEVAYELLAKRQYDHVGAEPGGATFVAGSGFWYVQHATAMALYNLDTQHSSSNAVGLSFDWIQGRSPFGQLTEYAYVKTFALGLVYFW